VADAVSGPDQDHPAARICTICARGGSRGVPNKNLRMLGGQTLVARAVHQARDSGLFATIAISSDSDAILASAREAGATVLVRRPAELASDAAGKIPAIRHCVERAEMELSTRFGIVVDLDVTVPLLSLDDIRGVVALLEGGDAENVVTGSASRHSPYFNIVERGQNRFVHLSKPPGGPVDRRQDSPACFDLNGAAYAWRRDALDRAARAIGLKTELYEMPASRSIDIDSELDWQIVEALFAGE
jgi:CMP-N,N'-diacetyllegionaminic acid synthase